MFEPIPIALLVALGLAWWWRASGRRGALLLATFWLAYAVYEFLMFSRILCSGECNIRVDLLLIYPTLLGCTLWAATAAAGRAMRRKNGVQGDT